MKDTIQVLIVEDDFRVANINREYVLKVAGYEVMHMTKTSEETLTFLANETILPDLIILDVYVPDDENLNLFRAIRYTYPTVDILILTAAKEIETIKTAIQGGVYDYLIKPADFSRFEKSLLKYKERFYTLSSNEELNQGEIDRLLGITAETADGGKPLPKGVDEITLQKIVNFLQSSTEEGVTALFVGEQVGVSRSTARRYLEYLVSIKEAEAKLKYGEVGRPERRYVP